MLLRRLALVCVFVAFGCAGNTQMGGDGGDARGDSTGDGRITGDGGGGDAAIDGPAGDTLGSDADDVVSADADDATSDDATDASVDAGDDGAADSGDAGTGDAADSATADSADSGVVDASDSGATDTGDAGSADSGDSSATDVADGADAADAVDVVPVDACIPTGAEVCDGIDNDCNGMADDGVLPRSCYTGPAGTAGVGICRAGVQMCMGGSFTACVGDVLPGAETCDGRDENCNGTIDDGVVPRACYAGPAGTVGVGVCRAGTQSCIAGTFGACTGEVLPSAETCDGRDNNCNGTVDEGIAPRVCYSGPAGTAGVGLCRTGTQTCSGGAFGACAGEIVPVAEVCDGLDNNCNAMIDDGNPGGGVACGLTVGQCRGVTQCVAGAISCRGTFVAPAPLGSATNSGSSSAPLNTITAGIANAVAIGGGADVCVCAVPGGAPATYTEDVGMVEGASVIGAYRCDTWVRGLGTYVTRIQDTTTVGVRVPAGLTAITALDGFTVIGLPSLVNTSSAITVTDASAQLIDLTVLGGQAPTSYGLRIVRSALGVSAPAVLRGTYNAAAPSGGLAVGVQIEQGTPTLTNVIVISNTGTPLTSVGVNCVGCGATRITGGSITSGSAETTTTGLWATGNVAGLTLVGPMGINGGSISVAAAGFSRGVHLDNCTGAPSLTTVNAFGASGNLGTHIGVDVAGAMCTLSANGGSMVGCEIGATCWGMQSTGSPATLDRVVPMRGGSAVSASMYGARCMAGGCTRFTNSTMDAGTLTAAGVSAGLLVDTTSPTFDSNRIIAPSCRGAGAPGGPYFGAHIRGLSSSQFYNNVIRDQTCFATEHSMFWEKPVAPVLAGINVVNNTIEYSACTGCGPRTGVTVTSAMVTPPMGVFNNNIIRNATLGAAALNIPFVETNVNSEVASFRNNDLFDPATPTIFLWRGAMPLATAAMVNAMVPGAAGNIQANPLLDPTWHLMALSPCRNTGLTVGTPVRDFDAQARPNELLFDIGADEFY